MLFGPTDAFSSVRDFRSLKVCLVQCCSIAEVSCLVGIVLQTTSVGVSKERSPPLISARHTLGVLLSFIIVPTWLIGKLAGKLSALPKTYSWKRGVGGVGGCSRPRPSLHGAAPASSSGS